MFCTCQALVAHLLLVMLSVSVMGPAGNCTEAEGVIHVEFHRRTTHNDDVFLATNKLKIIELVNLKHEDRICLLLAFPY